MKENFKIILSAFEEAGIDMGTVQFNITEYSLKTRLSFKFKNYKEFLEFLQLNKSHDKEKTADVYNAIVEEGINPDSFFYVNFFKPKVTEL